MPIGPGKYGARAAQLLREVDAGLVVVITLGGKDGPAFDVASTDPDYVLELPAILRRTADAVEAENRLQKES